MKWLMTHRYYTTNSEGDYFFSEYTNLEKMKINNIVLSYGMSEPFNCLGYTIKIHLNSNMYDFSHFFSKIVEDCNNCFPITKKAVVSWENHIICLKAVEDFAPVEKFIIWADDKIEGFSADFRLEIMNELKFLRINLHTLQASSINNDLDQTAINKLFIKKNSTGSNKQAGSTNVIVNTLNKAPETIGDINNNCTIVNNIQTITNKNSITARNNNSSESTTDIDGIDLSAALEQSKINYNAEAFTREKYIKSDQNLTKFIDLEEEHNFSDPDSDTDDFASIQDPFKYNEMEALQLAQEISKHSSNNSSGVTNQHPNQDEHDNIVYKHTAFAKR